MHHTGQHNTERAAETTAAFQVSAARVGLCSHKDTITRSLSRTQSQGPAPQTQNQTEPARPHQRESRVCSQMWNKKQSHRVSFWKLMNEAFVSRCDKLVPWLRNLFLTNSERERVAAGNNRNTSLILLMMTVWSVLRRPAGAKTNRVNKHKIKRLVNDFCKTKHGSDLWATLWINTINI